MKDSRNLYDLSISVQYKLLKFYKITNKTDLIKKIKKSIGESNIIKYNILVNR